MIANNFPIKESRNVVFGVTVISEKKSSWRSVGG